MKIVIIEDEKLTADHLEKQILAINKNYKIVAKLESVEDSVKWLSENYVDLIFLDIQLSDGLSFSIFDQVKVTAQIIFTTAFDQYAIKAFRLNSVDYLLKPIDKTDLKESLNRFEERYNSKLKKEEINFSELINFLKIKKEYKTRFVVFAGSKIKSIPIEEIAYFYITERNVFLTTFDNIQYDIDFTIEKLEDIVDPQYFFRLNRKIIVNIKAIKNIYVISSTKIKVTLTPAFSDDVLISMSRIANFKEWLNK